MRGRVVAALALLLGAAAPDTVGGLLDRLRTAPSAAQAEALEAQILAGWQAAISPAVQLLVGRATQSLGKQDPRTAIGDLDAALDLQPELAELWRLHAEARLANGDEPGALADLAQALSREPRCFPALADLSRLAESRKNYAGALEAWTRLLAIDPRVHQGLARLAVLQREASGQAL
jgi:tetratricopeptide (TPR) repeat protein